MGTSRREFLRAAAGAVALLATGAGAAVTEERVLTRLTTPAGQGPPDLIVEPTRVLVGPGATQGVDPSGGTKEMVVSAATLVASPVAEIRPVSTAYVFLAADATAAWLDPDVLGRNLPVNQKVFRVGRAWRAGSGDWVSCRGRRRSDGSGGVEVVYDVAGDPGPAMWLDMGASDGPDTWTRSNAPFDGASGGMLYDALATVSGGGAARLRIVTNNQDPDEFFELPALPTGRDQPVAIVLGNIGDVLEFQTDHGTTIDLRVTKGTETV